MSVRKFVPRPVRVAVFIISLPIRLLALVFQMVDAREKRRRE